ncbi:MAG: T9SS type A sorting domain-containing protein [Bacteroidetes bacterium]|nr:T9SS type A sorting domain-containing protein [Bacteroidota bacterium]
MRKLVIIFTILISVEGYSQISLDFHSLVPFLRTVKLSNTVTKYSQDFNDAYSIAEFTLYNLNGTIYKTIYLPPNPYPSSIVYYISNISTSLFDHDSTTIEYLITYACDSSGYGFHQIQVIREDGTVLLNEPKADVYYWPSNFDNASIYNTEEGAKLKLYCYFANGVNNGTKVFSLPGDVPTSVNENQSASNINALIYPNPNDGSFFVKISSNHPVISTIDLLSSNGKLLDTFKSSNSTIQENYPELVNGMYFLHIKTEKTGSIKKMIIQK